MKRSAASAWNYLLSLEGQDSSTKPRLASASLGEETSAGNNGAVTTAPGSSSSASARNADMPPRASTPSTGQHELLHLNDGVKLVIGMVGLPARGKSHIARKVANYFSWIGYAAKHFEVAAIRREKLGAVESQKFFDPSNKMGNEARAQFRGAAMDAMIAWLQDEGQVAVYDTSNATREQRKAVEEKLESTFRGSGKSGWCRLIWIECVCDDPATIERNFFESTIKSADFGGLSQAEALVQFKKKMDHYAASYCGLEEDDKLDVDASFIKISDGGKRVVAHNVMGYLEAKLVSFVMNIHSEPRVVLLARHGQTDYNLADRVGGDSDITEKGRRFGVSLGRFCRALEKRDWVPFGDMNQPQPASGSSATTLSGNFVRNLEDFDDEELDDNISQNAKGSSDLVVWISTAHRTEQTVETVSYKTKVAWNALTEIDAGVCESMTYHEIRIKMPLEYAERQKDKYHWRYPRGESYADVTRRLEPVIFELERQRRPVLVVAHRAVLRCLLGYFQGTPKDLVPYIPVPLHAVVLLQSGREGWRSKSYFLKPAVEDKKEVDSELNQFQTLLEQHQANGDV
jgi:broad specificity phosphatase PhoE